MPVSGCKAGIGHRTVKAVRKAVPYREEVEGRPAGGVLLVAVGCGRLQGMLDIASRHPFVVFATMDGEVLAGLASHGRVGPTFAPPTYFYETG